MAYLLKKSRPDRIDRKPVREYKANLEIFKKKMRQEEEKESQRQAQFKNKEDEDLMNVDEALLKHLKRRVLLKAQGTQKTRLINLILEVLLNFRKIVLPLPTKKIYNSIWNKYKYWV